MMPGKDYFKFSKKVAKMLKTCLLYTRRPGDEVRLLGKEFGLSPSEVAFINGASSLTENNIYYINIVEAQKHKDELLAMCAALPKLKTVVRGTAGTISYTDLLPDIKTDINTFTMSCEHADKFIGLLTINRIGFAKEISGTGSFKAAPIDLMYKYKDQVNPDSD